MRLVDALPQFTDELRAALVAADRQDLAAQLSEAVLDRHTYDTSCDAAYLYLRPTRALNVVEQNIIGAKHGETVSVDHELGVCVDVDNFGRLSGIELLSSGTVVSRLRDLNAP